MQTPTIAAPRRGTGGARWIRTLHIWIGLWGALGAVLYGSSGLIMSHRFGDGAWPQGDSSDAGRSTLAVPLQARGSAETLSLWLEDAHGLDAQLIRKPREGETGKPWTLSGGSARDGWSLDYVPGSAEAQLKRTRYTPLAALNRLHKAIAGGMGWRLLADSFAVCMVLLGLSGLWLWLRSRSAKTITAGIAGTSAVATALVLVLNLL